MSSMFTSPSEITSKSYRRPYLNFKEKVTQIIINPYTIFLCLLIIKLLFFISSINSSLDQAKKQTNLIFLSTQAFANNIVSIPHYLSKGANYAVAKGLEQSNKGFIESLSLMITAAEELIFFMIELSVGTYACLLMAVIDNTAIAALNATEDVIGIANETLISFAKDLDSGLADLTNIVNEVIDVADDTGDALKNMFSSGSSSSSSNSDALKVNEQMSHVNLTIQNMEHWVIPASINSDIEKLKQEIPDFNDVKTYVEDLLDKPFTEMKKQVNLNLNRTFDPDFLYVPDKKNIDIVNLTDTIDAFYEEVKSSCIRVTHIIIIILGILMLLFICYETFREFRTWRIIQVASTELYVANDLYIETPIKRSFNIEVISAMQNRTADIIGRFFSAKLFRLKSPVHINNMRWLINYAASPYLLSLLLLGLLGILSFICQFIILQLLMNAHELTDSVEEAFSNTALEIKENFNTSIYDWVDETNDYLADYQNDVNENMLGWVSTSTTAINDTVTEFDNKMNEAIDAIFKGTPLYDPVEQIVWCVVESKLKKIENAMTWLNENAKLNISNIDPEQMIDKLNKEINSDGDNSMDSELSEKITELRSKIISLFKKVIEIYKKETFLTLYISLAILGIWLLFIGMAAFILLLREIGTRRRSNSAEAKGVLEEKNLSLNTSIYSSGPDVKQSACASSLCSSLEGLASQNSMARALKSIYQSVKERYNDKSQYVKTPTEPALPSNGEIDKIRKTFENDEGFESSWNTIWNGNHYENNRDENHGSTKIDNNPTYSEIDENSLSLKYARRWTP